MEKVKIYYGTVTFTILFLVSLVLAYYARYVILSALMGIGLGVLFTPILSLFRKKFNLPKALSALVVFLAIILLVLGVFWSIFFIVSDQVKLLSERAPQIIDGLNGWVTKLFGKYPWIEDQISHLNPAAYFKQSIFTVYRGFQASFAALTGAVFALVIGLYTAVDGKVFLLPR